MFSKNRPVGRLSVAVVSHAYNGSGRIGPFAALGKRVDLTLIAPREHPDGTLTPAVVLNGELPVGIFALRTFRLGRSQFLMSGLRKALRSAKPDVVCVEYDPWHIQFLQVLLTLKFARSAAHVVPIVKKNTYRAPTSLLGRGKWFLSRWGIRRSSAIIAASTKTRELYICELGAPESVIVVQPHLAVDTYRFRPRENSIGYERPLRIGFVGKIGETKGVPDLLAAFEIARRRSRIDVELWLAGGVTDANTNLAISRAEHVHYVGVVDNNDLHEFVDDIDVFAMPARILPDHEEHDGRAVLEAMSAGIPCVVSDSGILPELVTPAEGRIFPAGDISRLADCLQELIDSSELRRQLGVSARNKAISTVSPDALSAGRIALFNKIMEVPHGRAASR